MVFMKTALAFALFGAQSGTEAFTVRHLSPRPRIISSTTPSRTHICMQVATEPESSPTMPVPKVPKEAWKWPPAWPFPPDFTEEIAGDGNAPVYSEEAKSSIQSHISFFVDKSQKVLEIGVEEQSLVCPVNSCLFSSARANFSLMLIDFWLRFAYTDAMMPTLQFTILCF